MFEPGTKVKFIHWNHSDWIIKGKIIKTYILDNEVFAKVLADDGNEFSVRCNRLELV